MVQGRRRLHDGDTLRFGATVLLFHDRAKPRVLIALCRPFEASTAFVTPAANEQIANEQFLSVDAEKKHMRALFGVEQLPQYEKPARLVERAFGVGRCPSAISDLHFALV